MPIRSIDDKKGTVVLGQVRRSPHGSSKYHDISRIIVFPSDSVRFGVNVQIRTEVAEPVISLNSVSKVEILKGLLQNLTLQDITGDHELKQLLIQVQRMI